MSRNLRMGFQNATGRPRAVLFEPWGREFLLDVDEKLEVLARTGPGPGLRLVETVDATLIYTEGCDTVCVVRGGTLHVLEPTQVAEAAPSPGPARDDDPMWDRDLDGRMIWAARDRDSR